jgi:anti-anti-sigma factor
MEVDGAPGLAVRGEIDVSVAIELELAVDTGIRDSVGAFVIDLCDVEFIDSTVINSLFAAAPRIRSNGGDMAIVVADSGVSRALEISGIDVLYSLVHTRRQALKRLGLTPARTG